MRPNRRVRVKFDAPGNLIPLRRATGTIIRVDNRIATVRLDLGGDARPIDATFLELWNDGVTPTPQDPPDLAAYKLRVARVAQRLGRQHNLCDVLDNALREIDIEPLPQQMAVITLTIPEESLDFSRDEDVEFEEDVADQLGDILLNAGTSQRRQYVTNVEFRDMTDLEKEEYA